jgi:hypothetical protein
LSLTIMPGLPRRSISAVNSRATRRPEMDVDVYPYLPKANVGTTSAASYMSLMRGRAA